MLRSDEPDLKEEGTAYQLLHRHAHARMERREIGRVTESLFGLFGLFRLFG